MRVVIAEDSVLLREGVSRLVVEAGFEVLAAVGDAESLLRAVGEHRPDLAVVDVRMPPTHTDEGLRAALVIRRQWPRVAILVLSQYVEERYANELAASNTWGVGYLLEDRVADVADFVDTLRRSRRGGRRRRQDPIKRLTPRELQVLALMAEGRSNAGLAKELVVSAGAIEKHVASIFAKLDLPPDCSDQGGSWRSCATSSPELRLSKWRPAYPASAPPASASPSAQQSCSPSH